MGSFSVGKRREKAGFDVFKVYRQIEFFYQFYSINFVSFEDNVVQFSNLNIASKDRIRCNIR